MPDIPLVINLFISLIELNNIHQKHQMKEHKFLLLINLLISLIELEHPSKISNKKTEVQI